MKAVLVPIQKLWPNYEFVVKNVTLIFDLDTWYHRKGLTTRNAHVKYKSGITYHSKVMVNVKIVCEKYDLDNWFWFWPMALTLVPQKRSNHKEYTYKI